MKTLSPLLMATALLLPGLAAAAAPLPGVDSSAGWNWFVTPVNDPQTYRGSDAVSGGDVGTPVRTVDYCGPHVPGGCSAILIPPSQLPPTVPEWVMTYDSLSGNYLQNDLVAEAKTEFGANHLRVWAGNPCTPGPVPCSSDGSVSGKSSFARSQWRDTFVYSGPPAAVVAYIGIEGAWTGGGRFTVTAGVDIGDGIGNGSAGSFSASNCLPDEPCDRFGEQQIFIAGDDDKNFAGRFQLLLPTTLFLETGDQVAFGVLMEADSGSGGPGSAMVDNFNTARLQRFVVPEGAALTALSGTDYAVVSEVPEPGAALLWAAGLAMLRVARRPRA